MVRKTLTAAAVLLLTFATSHLRAAADREIRWQTIDVPGAASTSVNAINAAGDVVGSFIEADGTTHGFVRSHQGIYETFDYVSPDGVTAVFTQATGIGPGGDIVGSYRMAGEPAMAFHSFLRARDGTVTALDFPGQRYTLLQKINADGTIVGCYHSSDMTNSMHAVMLNNGVWSALDTARTMANAVTPGETLEVGRFVDLKTGRNHGWIISDNTMTLFDFPGSAATNPMGINPAGDVVGWYRDVALIYHGFFLHSGEFTSLDFPGALQTDAFDINPGGDIVGSYDDAVTQHGYIASRTARHEK